MQLTGEQGKALREALMSAYPNEDALRIFVMDVLGQDLNRISQGDTYQAVTFDLIRWSESEGRVEELVGGALRDKPGNPELQRFIAVDIPASSVLDPGAATLMSSSDNARQGPPADIATAQASASLRQLPNATRPQAARVWPATGAEDRSAYIQKQQIDRLRTKQQELDLNVRGYISSRELLDLCTEFRRELGEGRDRQARLKDRTYWRDLGSRLDELWSEFENLSKLGMYPERMGAFEAGHSAASEPVTAGKKNPRSLASEEALDALDGAAESMWRAIQSIPTECRQGAEERLAALAELLASLFQLGTSEERELPAGRRPAPPAGAGASVGLAQDGQGSRWPGDPGSGQVAFGSGPA